MTVQMTQQMLYGSLPSPTCTRLVVLQPGTLQTPLDARLIKVDLKAQPAYEAVSYTWGSADHQQLIRLNGHAVHIRHNLHSFLCRIRYRNRERTVWVDAISISQHDLEEKAQQVAMIGNIFGQASRVLAWLGEHADGSEELFRKTISSLPSMWKSLKQIIDPPTFGNRAKVWGEMVHRPYFSRTWIIQELLLARAVAVHCGNDSQSWADFVDRRFKSIDFDQCFDGIPITMNTGAPRIKLNSGETVEFEHVMGYFKRYETIRKRLGNRGSKHGTAHQNDLMKVHIGFLAGTECFDRRDRVYALLALANDYTIKPDYTIDMPELFLRVYRSHYSKHASSYDPPFRDHELPREIAEKVVHPAMGLLRLEDIEICRMLDILFEHNDPAYPTTGWSEFHYAAPICIAASAQIHHSSAGDEANDVNHVFFLMDNVRNATEAIVMSLRADLEAQACGP